MSPHANVTDALAAARGLGLDRLDAQLLLGHVLERPRVWLLAHGDALVSHEAFAAFDALARRRADGEPLAYLTGEREFHGLRLRVGPGVLVPRSDTETLVEWALALLGTGGDLAGRSAAAIADLGTGSGAIALALKHRQPAATVTAVDASPAALAIARANGERLGLDIRWCLGDWLEAVPGERFDLVVSNPPYVAEGDPHWPGLRHEPRTALAAGPSGLDDLRRIVAAAPGSLRDGAWLLLEHGAEQGAAVRGLLATSGFHSIESRHDLAGRERCSGGCWCPPRADLTIAP